LYLVLSNATHVTDGMADTVLFAILATAGPPIDSRPRTATRFEMREGSSGALYDWQSLEPVRTLQYGDEENGSLLGVANFVLPYTSGQSGRGFADLVYGVTYTLDIETEGVQIHGETTLPARFGITITTINGARTVSWPHVQGAAGYFVAIWKPESFLGRFGKTTTDTSLAIPAQYVAGDSLAVEARDVNYIVAQQDQASAVRRGRVGIDRGYGVFAAATRSTSVIP
jgi:hypothetical protein